MFFGLLGFFFVGGNRLLGMASPGSSNQLRLGGGKAKGHEENLETPFGSRHWGGFWGGEPATNGGGGGKKWAAEVSQKTIAQKRWLIKGGLESGWASHPLRGGKKATGNGGGNWERGTTFGFFFPAQNYGDGSHNQQGGIFCFGYSGTQPDHGKEEVFLGFYTPEGTPDPSQNRNRSKVAKL